MRYVIYDNKGRIESFNHDEFPCGQYLEVTEDYNPRLFHYVADGKVVPGADQPSSFHTFDYTLKQWIDPRTLDDLKAQQWETIKAARTQAEYGGFTWDGSAFDSDAVSQARLTGAVQLAQLNPAMTLDWTLKNNTVRTLSAADLIAVGVALGVHVATQFAKGQALRAQIDAATAKEAVEAIVW